MAAEPPAEEPAYGAVTVDALADGLKIAAPTSTTVYYKIVMPITIGNGTYIEFIINSPCMETGDWLTFVGACDVEGANAVTFAYDTTTDATSARIVEWSVE